MVEIRSQQTGGETIALDRRRLLAAGALMSFVSPRALPFAAAAPKPAIGEMIVMGFRGADPSAPGAKAIADWLYARLIGGVIFFDDNLPSPDAAKKLIAHFRAAASGFTPFFCVDQEGGAVSRLRPEHGFMPLPAAAYVASLPIEEAAALYEREAAELLAVGFNVNFAPVVDLESNRSSRIISQLGRSFGSDPDKVIAYAKTCVDAYRRHHILTAIKHFPGHGSTAADSHLQLPDITASWSRQEMRPFAELASTGYADMVMVGHLVHEEVTEPGRPASLSKRAVTGLLRESLGYHGVVVSDDMQMGALRKWFLPDDAILFGVDAGVDLFIFSNREHPDPQMPKRFHTVVNAAIGSGRLSAQRVEESVARLRRVRRTLDLVNARPLENDR